MRDLLNRNRENLQKVVVESNFDYSDILDDDRIFLIKQEEELRVNKMRWENSSLEIGRILTDVKETIKNYSGDNRFMSYYSNLGFNKDFVSFYMKAYKLYNEHNQNFIVNNMSRRTIEYLSSKKVPEELVDEVFEKNISDMRSIKEVAKKYIPEEGTLYNEMHR